MLTNPRGLSKHLSGNNYVIDVNQIHDLVVLLVVL